LAGVDRFADDIASMIGHRPGIYWRICWKFIAPCFLLVRLIIIKLLAGLHSILYLAFADSFNCDAMSDCFGII